MFGRKPKKIEFDRDNQQAVIKCSICTGERAAGFKNINTGEFCEVMLIRNDKDLEKFMVMYDLDSDSVSKEY